MCVLAVLFCSVCVGRGLLFGVDDIYDGLRQLQQELPARAAAGEDIDALAEETWALFCSIR